MEDYTKYLSYDNGCGLLIPSYDKMILDYYSVCYDGLTNMQDLIVLVSQLLDVYDDEELEEVISHLSEIHYYQEVNK